MERARGRMEVLLLTNARTKVEQGGGQIQPCPYPGCEWVAEHPGSHQGPGIEPREPVDGAFVEDVIAAAADRIDSYQRGRFPSEENAAAIFLLEGALAALDRRTARREAAGVEGTHQR